MLTVGLIHTLTVTMHMAAVMHRVPQPLPRMQLPMGPRLKAPSPHLTIPNPVLTPITILVTCPYYPHVGHEAAYDMGCHGHRENTGGLA